MQSVKWGLVFLSALYAWSALARETQKENVTFEEFFNDTLISAQAVAPDVSCFTVHKTFKDGKPSEKLAGRYCIRYTGEPKK